MSNENIVLARNTERAPKHHLAAQTVAFSHYNHLSAQYLLSQPLDNW